MNSDTPCQLTAKDFSVLEGMMDRLEAQALADAAIARLLRRKLATARICFRDDVDPRVATINSRIQLRVGEGSAETRVLTHGGESALPGTALPISSLRGLAVLGLMEGDTISVEGTDGKSEVLHVVRVVHQPEAARLTNPRGGLRLVSGTLTESGRADEISARATSEGPEGDDPGPSAA